MMRAVLAIELEALVPVHAHRDRQVEMAEHAIGELGIHEPAIGAERARSAALAPATISPHEIAGGIHEMASHGRA